MSGGEDIQERRGKRRKHVNKKLGSSVGLDEDDSKLPGKDSDGIEEKIT